MEFYDFVDRLTLACPLILTTGVFAGSWKFRYLDDVHRLLTLYLLVSLTADLASRFYVFSHTNNLVFILLFSLLELGLFTVIYFRLFFLRGKPMLLVLSLLGLAFIGWELLHSRFSDTSRFQSYSKVVDTFLIVSFAVAYLFERLRQRQAMWMYFRLNAIVLAFFSFNLLFFLPLNLLINEESGLKFWFWFGNLVATLVFYTLLTREVWINGTSHRQ